METIVPMAEPSDTLTISKPTRLANESVDVASCQFLGTLLCVDVAELDQADTVVAEAVLFQEEWYQNAINVENQIVGIYAVEDVVSKLERHLAFDTVRLA